MMMVVFIEPHERDEALVAYDDWLTAEQKREIEDAPETAIIRLAKVQGATQVTVIEEG